MTLGRFPLSIFCSRGTPPREPTNPEDIKVFGGTNSTLLPQWAVLFWRVPGTNLEVNQARQLSEVKRVNFGAKKR